MNKREEIIKSYLLYKKLFTKKQQEYFESYYFEDLSLSEIAENYKVTKTIVGKTINIVEKKLEEYEVILKIKELHNKIEKAIINTKDENTKKELEDIIK